MGKIGIKDIAEAAGVSKSTVSNALNGKENIGRETRERILEICRRLNYYPQINGKKLKSGESKAILFNFSDFDRSFYLKIIEGVNEYASDNGYDMIVCTSKSCEKYMCNGMTDGAIILDSRMDNECLKRCAGANYPLILLDRVLEHPGIKSLVVNNYDPMCELMQMLVDRGNRKFAFLGGLDFTEDNIDRYRAFRDVLEQNGIPFQSENYYTGDYRERSGQKAAKIIMLAHELPDVLVCANDNMAIGAIRYFKAQGLRVPEDISVTGFDDCDMARIMNLTTVAIPNFERGYLAARHLIENIRRKQNEETLKITASVKWRKTAK